MIPLITLSLFRPVFAISRFEADNQESPDLEDQYKQAAGELESWFKKTPVYTIKTDIVDQSDLGYYFDNISFKDAYELNYSGNTGVIVSGSRSWNTNPVLQREDIVVKIDGAIISNRSSLEDIVETKDVGDTIIVEYFRHGETFTKAIPVLKKESSWDNDYLFKNTAHKKRKNYGI